MSTLKTPFRYDFVGSFLRPEKLKAAKKAFEELAQSQDLKALDAVRVKYLGKKGELTAILKQMGKLSAEERKQLDITYAKTFSFWLDIKIILKTVTAFIQKENV